MKLAHCLLPLVIGAGAAPLAADSLTDFFPPDTTVVFGIRVHNLVFSSVAQSFKAQAQAAAAGWLKIPLESFDMLRDVDELLIASNGRGPTPTGIVVAAGRLQALRAADEGERYHDVPILRNDGDLMVAMLDNSTVLIGTPGLVKAAIDRPDGKPALDAVLNDRITSLRQRYDVWGLGQQPDGFFAPVRGAKLIQSMDRFQFGMQLVNGLELNAEMHGRNAQETAKLNAMFEKIGAILKAQQTEESAKFDLKPEDGDLKLTVAMPEEALQRAIDAETVALPKTAPPPSDPPAVESAAPEVAADPPATAPPVAIAPPLVAAATPAPAPSAPPASAQAPSAPAPEGTPAPAPAGAQVLDKEGNTVILTLPGKK